MLLVAIFGMRDTRDRKTSWRGVPSFHASRLKLAARNEMRLRYSIEHTPLELCMYYVKAIDRPFHLQILRLQDCTVTLSSQWAPSTNATSTDEDEIKRTGDMKAGIQ